MTRGGLSAKVGPCPHCGFKMYVKDNSCPHCDHILSEDEQTKLKNIFINNRNERINLDYVYYPAVLLILILFLYSAFDSIKNG